MQLGRHAVQRRHAPPRREGAFHVLAHVEAAAARGGDEDEAEAVEIGPWPDQRRVARELFGRGIGQLAGERRPQRIESAVARDAEVDDRRAVRIAARQDDVVGREVAVDHPLLVRGGEPVGQPHRQPPQPLGLQRAVAQHLAQRRPLNELDHQEKLVAVLDPPERAVLDHRVVLDPLHGVRLGPEKAEELLAVGNVGQHDLQRDPLVLVMDVARLVDRPAAAFAEQRDDAEMADHLAGRQRPGAKDGALVGGLGRRGGGGPRRIGPSGHRHQIAGQRLEGGVRAAVPARHVGAGEMAEEQRRHHRLLQHRHQDAALQRVAGFRPHPVRGERRRRPDDDDRPGGGQRLFLLDVEALPGAAAQIPGDRQPGLGQRRGQRFHPGAILAREADENVRHEAAPPEAASLDIKRLRRKHGASSQSAARGLAPNGARAAWDVPSRPRGAGAGVGAGTGGGGGGVLWR